MINRKNLHVCDMTNVLAREAKTGFLLQLLYFHNLYGGVCLSLSQCQ